MYALLSLKNWNFLNKRPNIGGFRGGYGDRNPPFQFSKIEKSYLKNKNVKQKYYMSFWFLIVINTR